MVALHGSVQANQDVLGWWSATRLSEEPGVENEYMCVVEEYAKHGTKTQHKFKLKHRFEDGSMALAARVLAHAAGVKTS